MTAPHRLSRRGLLTAGLGAGGLGGLNACGGGDVDSTGTTDPDGSTDGPERLTYGDDPSQWADLYRPGGGSGTSRGVVVVIHGGFWKAEYDLELARPLAADLARRGWTAWAIEYRRVELRGGRRHQRRDRHRGAVSCGVCAGARGWNL